MVREGEREEEGERENGKNWQAREKAGWNSLGDTVFVGCLPLEIDVFGLRGVFNKAGSIVRVTIGRHQSFRFGRYAFVRFKNGVEANRSITLFNNKTLRRKRLVVQHARNSATRYTSAVSHRPHTQSYGQRERQENQKRIGSRRVSSNNHQHDWTTKNRNNQTEKMQSATMAEEGNLKINLMNGKINPNMQKWLEKSLVGEVIEAAVLSDLENKIKNVLSGVVKIVTLSINKFIIIMESNDKAEEAILQSHLLNPWFKSICKWSKYDAADSRSAWIEVFGVPPLGWYEENFENIAACWGSLERFEHKIDSLQSIQSFQSMKLMINTKIMSNIEGEFILSLQDTHHRVFVKEVQMRIQLVPNSLQDVGMDDDQAPVKSPQEVHQTASPKKFNLNLYTDDVSRVEETPTGNDVSPHNDSKEGETLGSPVNMLAKGPVTEEAAAECYEKLFSHPNMSCMNENQDSHTEATKTKTAFLVDSPLAVNLGCRIEESSVSKKLNEVSLDSEDSISVPPGFEEVTSGLNFRNTPVGRRKRKRQCLKPKINKKSRKIKKGGKASRDVDWDSSSNGSIYKLAKEAVDLGNKLGLKIIGNEKGAIKRISNSIRRQRMEAVEQS